MGGDTGSSFAVDKLVPVPNKTRRNKYPFREMAVGDSFLVSTDQAHAARRAAHCHAARWGDKFMTRTVDGGLRIWRVK